MNIFDINMIVNVQKWGISGLISGANPPAYFKCRYN